MIILITGASHTGKTLLAQKILDKYHFSYLSIDILKMGLIRSNNINLMAENDIELQKYLWPIVREMIKTSIENQQNLVVEGGYIPFGWEEDFSDDYLNEIRYCCLVMSKRYIENHFSDIKAHACEIEKRIDDSWCTKDFVLKENEYYMNMCKKYNYIHILIDELYQVDVDFLIES